MGIDLGVRYRYVTEKNTLEIGGRDTEKTNDALFQRSLVVQNHGVMTMHGHSHDILSQKLWGLGGLQTQTIRNIPYHLPCRVDFCLQFTIKINQKQQVNIPVPWILWVWYIHSSRFSGVFHELSWGCHPPEALGSTHDFHHHSSRGLGPRGGDDAKKCI